MVEKTHLRWRRWQWSRWRAGRRRFRGSTDSRESRRSSRKSQWPKRCHPKSPTQCRTCWPLLRNKTIWMAIGTTIWSISTSKRNWLIRNVISLSFKNDLHSRTICSKAALSIWSIWSTPRCCKKRVSAAAQAPIDKMISPMRKNKKLNTNTTYLVQAKSHILTVQQKKVLRRTWWDSGVMLKNPSSWYERKREKGRLVNNVWKKQTPLCAFSKLLIDSIWRSN